MCKNVQEKRCNPTTITDRKHHTPQSIPIASLIFELLPEPKFPQHTTRHVNHKFILFFFMLLHRKCYVFFCFFFLIFTIYNTLHTYNNILFRSTSRCLISCDMKKMWPQNKNGKRKTKNIKKNHESNEGKMKGKYVFKAIKYCTICNAHIATYFSSF